MANGASRCRRQADSLENSCWNTTNLQRGEWFASRSGKLCCVKNADHCATRRSSPVAQHKFRRNITRVAIAARILLGILLPQDRQRYVLALELAVDPAPVRLDVAAVALLGAGVGVELVLQRRVGHVVGKRPRQPRRPEPLHGRSHCRGRDPQTPGDLAASYSAGKRQSKNLAHLAHRNPLCWHSVPPSDKPKGATLRASRRGLHPGLAPGGIIPESRAASSRNRGRHHLGTVGAIISEWWAASPGIRSQFSRDSPDDCRSGVNIRAFP